MRFRTFIQRMMLIPAQVLRTERRLVVRLLDWNPWRHAFFRALDSVPPHDVGDRPEAGARTLWPAADYEASEGLSLRR